MRNSRRSFKVISASGNDSHAPLAHVVEMSVDDTSASPVGHEEGPEPPQHNASQPAVA